MSINIPSQHLARVSKPLRCTSLHQSILPASPSAPFSLPSEHSTPLNCEDSNDELSDDTDDSLDSVISCDDAYSSTANFDLRRTSTSNERPKRRHSTSLAKFKAKGLSLSYTSPSTTAAINEVNSRRTPISPTNERATFLLELPDAIARARKVHYRRDALLPKTKSFNRVQNSLKEDSQPTESDIQKEMTLARILKREDKELKPPIEFEDEKDETVFSIEDIGPSRPGKRKSDDLRFEPYGTKRRAVSPSPGSPLNSPPIKGATIFSISELKL